MGLRIDMSEMHEQISSMNRILKQKNHAAHELLTAITSFEHNTILKGRSYQSAKAYMCEVHLPITKGIIRANEEIIKANRIFISSFRAQVDGSSSSRIDTDRLEDLKNRMDALSHDMADLMEGNLYYYHPIRSQMLDTQKMIDHIQKLHSFNSYTSGIYHSAERLLEDVKSGLSMIKHGTWDVHNQRFSYKTTDIKWRQRLNEDWVKNQKHKIASLDPKAKLYLNQAKTDYKNKKISDKLYQSIQSGIINTGAAFIQNTIESKVTDKVAGKISQEMIIWLKENTTHFMNRGLVAAPVAGGVTTFSEPPSWLTTTVRTGAVRSAPLIGSILDFSLQVSRGENVKDAAIKTGGHLGAGLAGAAIGTALGGPGLGTGIGYLLGVAGSMAFDWVYDHKDEIASQTKKLAEKAVNQTKEIGKDAINLGKKGINQMSQVAKIERDSENQLVNKVNEIGKYAVTQVSDKGKEIGQAVSGFFGNLGSAFN
jgi:hypothetical protein